MAKKKLPKALKQGGGQAETLDLAVTVISERINQLHKLDQEDLWELFPKITCADAEEREAAMRAISEILIQAPHRLTKMDCTNVESSQLDLWLSLVSQRIRELRKKAGLTQACLAELAGLPQSYISRLELGQHSPTAKTLQKLADALGCETSDFDVPS